MAFGYPNKYAGFKNPTLCVGAQPGCKVGVSVTWVDCVLNVTQSKTRNVDTNQLTGLYKSGVPLWDKYAFPGMFRV